MDTIPQHDQWITSVYMDNKEHDLYATRLRREEGARLLRLRWYGLAPDKSIYVERKTHHEHWVRPGRERPCSRSHSEHHPRTGVTVD